MDPSVKSAAGKLSALLVAVLVCALAVALLIGESSARPARREANEAHRFVRWDIAQCHSHSCGSLVIGGQALWRSASGSRIRFTGSGEAEPHEGEAAGGGTWTRMDSRGRVVGRGAYRVTGFIYWRGFGGSLGNVVDAVGHRQDYRVGILKLRIRMFGIGKGRLVICSVLGRERLGHLFLRTHYGRTVTYRERVRPKGQPLFHRMG
jgi:hypothetical protein